MRAWIFSVLIALAACGRAPEMALDGVAQQESAQEFAAVGAGAPAAPTEASQDRSQAAPAQSAPAAAPVLYLAYAYAMSIETPADRLIGVMDGHIAACREAGPRVCQLISSGRDGDAETYLRGSLSLRAAPDWLARFMARIEADADAADGRVRAKSTSTEDLTRAIVDTEARLRAMTTLRDRLQAILATRPGRVADLLEVERELARVQGEIDSTRSSLAVMRARVEMSELTVDYQSEPRSVTTSTFEPLGQALAGFLGNVVAGLAAIVTVFAVALPWLVVLGLAAWGARALWRRRRARRASGAP